MTPHNEAKVGDIAETVLLSGDPLRAKFVADNYLENVIQYNSVRGMLGFTGTYKGQRISVQGSGMGIPSIGIYSYELIHTYGVKNLVRIGSAGAISENLELGDIVIAMSASTDSNYLSQFNLGGTYAPTASYKLFSRACKIAEQKKIPYFAGNILSSDVFYSDEGLNALEKWRKMGVLAVEMESAALYANASRAGVNALTLLTISDKPMTGESMSSIDRQTSFDKMMQIALELTDS